MIKHPLPNFAQFYDSITLSKVMLACTIRDEITKYAMFCQVRLERQARGKFVSKEIHSIRLQRHITDYLKFEPPRD